MLTDEQIKYLFRFCEKHYVRYYDVQVELVDHLANAIEEKRSLIPNLSFDKALTQIFNGFGIMGFSPIISAKETQLERESKKMRWQLFRSYFTWPKLGFTVLLFAIFSLPILFLPKNYWQIAGITMFLGSMPFALVQSLYLRINPRYKRKKELLSLKGLEFTLIAPELLLFFNGINLLYALHLLSPSASIHYLQYEGLALLSAITLIYSLAGKHQYINTLDKARKNYPKAFASH